MMKNERHLERVLAEYVRRRAGALFSSALDCRARGTK